jgi:hypothetical protein
VCVDLASHSDAFPTHVVAAAPSVPSPTSAPSLEASGTQGTLTAHIAGNVRPTRAGTAAVRASGACGVHDLPDRVDDRLRVVLGDPVMAPRHAHVAPAR